MATGSSRQFRGARVTPTSRHPPWGYRALRSPRPIGLECATRRCSYAGVAAIAAAAALAASPFWQRHPPEPVARAVRFQIETAKTLNPLNIALSPDGAQIAYVGETERGNALWVRPLDSLEARVLLGSEGVSETSYPFWSPDGGEIAYRTAHGLGRVNFAGGLTNTIVDGVSLFRRAAWGADGTVLYGTEKVIHRVPVAGGEPVAVSTLDPAAGETAHSAPQFLPDGKHFLYKATNVDWRKGAIYIGSLDPEERAAAAPRSVARNLRRARLPGVLARERAVRPQIRRDAARAHGAARADRR